MGKFEGLFTASHPMSFRCQRFLCYFRKVFLTTNFNKFFIKCRFFSQWCLLNYYKIADLIWVCTWVIMINTVLLTFIQCCSHTYNTAHTHSVLLQKAAVLLTFSSAHTFSTAHSTSTTHIFGAAHTQKAQLP